MKLVHFTSYNGKRHLSFVANKVISFTESPGDSDKTLIIVQTPSDNDEFIVGENYGQVLVIMDLAEDDSL